MPNNISDDTPNRHVKHDSIIKVVEYIKDNYNKNHSVQHYADICSLDKYYFIKLFGEYTGESPHLFRTKIRIEKAKELLSNTKLSNAKIAEAVGYSSSYYFSRIFKTHTGISPTEYRKNNK